jgi:hypothetical protein
MGAGRHHREAEVLTAIPSSSGAGGTRLAHQQADLGQIEIGGFQFPEQAHLHDRAARVSEAKLIFHLLLSHCVDIAARGGLPSMKKPGVVSRPGAAREFQFPQYADLGGGVNE